ncbi:hypothetical protein [Sphingomonas morindae]|uniref:Uncharacterized protein n=1 Tax=Sphingomonas morindae TaxID=1541170 RepID=A0ABY4XDT7_9SPHN|nr:hypothetical protein [Sphingomonas morindae]USI75129.1 hypothetical protein LHA26_19760 [Sphingomonas morindae]
MQQMTSGLGIAFGAVCSRFASTLSAGGSLAVDHRFTVADSTWAFVFTSLLTLLPTIAYWRLPAEAGDSLAHS